MAVLQVLFRRTFQNVTFGICLMVLVAVYIAVGSGVIAVRNYFEMTDLQFFNAWPLKVLLLLLVINLVTVTWTRIPFTPPRYGVWTIHAGIIVLIGGFSVYYRFKQEGFLRLVPGRSETLFYDTTERSLYVMMPGRMSLPAPLLSLPRYRAYDEKRSPGMLKKSDLQGIRPLFGDIDQTTFRQISHGVAKDLGLKDEVLVDVLAYYPYAAVQTSFVTEPGSNLTGVSLDFSDAGAMSTSKSMWLVASNEEHRRMRAGNVEFEHRHLSDPKQLAAVAAAATKMHHLEVKQGGTVVGSLDVEVGKTYSVPKTGYTLAVVQFDPSFPLSDTGEQVPVLTLKVRKGETEFNRMVINGRVLQTDFLLGGKDAGPLGKRQKEPLDKELQIDYTFSDAFGLLPMETPERVTILTCAGSKQLTTAATGYEKGSDVENFENGECQLTFAAGEAGQAESPHEGAAPVDPHQRPGATVAPAVEKPPLKLWVKRRDDVKVVESVVEVPKQQQIGAIATGGDEQVLKVRVRCGAWSQELFVPYAQLALDIGSWRGASVQIPGANSALQLQLGQTYRALPAALTLEKFEAVPYPGGEANGMSMMRDFRSTLMVENTENGARETATASLNSPVYFRDSYGLSWLFFQSGWDPDGQKFSMIGVGNRPAVGIMIGGCVMIFVGLLYAFYAKPIVIRRMKLKALAEAEQKTKKSAGGFGVVVKSRR